MVTAELVISEPSQRTPFTYVPDNAMWIIRSGVMRDGVTTTINLDSLTPTQGSFSATARLAFSKSATTTKTGLRAS